MVSTEHPRRLGLIPPPPWRSSIPLKKTPNYMFLTFFQDGRVKKGLPMMGLDEYLAEPTMRHDIASSGKSAAQWGLYEIASGRGQIVFADARTGGQQLVSGLRGEAWPIAMNGTRLNIGDTTYVRLFGGNGLHLDGAYKPVGDTKGPGITFTRDGTFVDEGILDSGASTAVGIGGTTVAFSSPGAGRGTYNIIRYGLHLHYTNSKAPNCLFFLEAEEATNDVQILYINNVKYQRVS